MTTPASHPPSRATNPETSHPATRPVRFFHRGAVTEVDPAQHTRTVLEWLREDARCTGTKEGCAEGDCGACTVVLGELGADGALQLKPVNACIQFLPTLDGKALFTVEDLGRADGSLHPVQASMVACHGSQCGFCTPGFVMSLWACWQRHTSAGSVPTRQQLADDLSGNLCRCTGYRPILDAGQQMFLSPANGPQAAADVAAAAAGGATGGAAAAAAAAAVAEDSAATGAAFAPALEPVRLALQRLAADAPLHTRSGFHAPRSVAELAALLLAQPQPRLLAGSTDMGLWVNKQFRELGSLVSINQVAELKAVATGAQHLHIGAAASLETAWQALVAEWPALRDVWLRFASLPIRQTGTMGGNVANGSPIGDSAPVLMALGADIVLQRGEQQRQMPLHTFYLDYMKNQLQPGEFVHSLRVPRRSAGQVVRAYKISKRFDCDISAVCAGFGLVLQAGVVTDARLAFGGMAATVRRAARAEAALVGQRWTETTLQAAQAALAQDFEPLSDMRASAGYRLQVAQNLLRRLWLETRPDAPLPESAVSVWARSPAA